MNPGKYIFNDLDFGGDSFAGGRLLVEPVSVVFIAPGED